MKITFSMCLPEVSIFSTVTPIYKNLVIYAMNLILTLTKRIRHEKSNINCVGRFIHIKWKSVGTQPCINFRLLVAQEIY